jgi:hypothetical protein
MTDAESVENKKLYLGEQAPAAVLPPQERLEVLCR